MEQKQLDKGKAKENVEEGRKIDVPSLFGKSGFNNRFEVLNSAVCNEEVDTKEFMGKDLVIKPRRMRAASAGVADLMKSLKSRKKGQIDKSKNKQTKAGATILGNSSQ